MLNQKPARLLELMNGCPTQVGIKRERTGVVGKGTRDDKDFRTNTETLGSVFAMSNPPDKNRVMTHLDEMEAN